MANRYKNLIYSTAEYTHSYKGLRGVELNGSESIPSSASRLAYSENMYKDYSGDGSEVIESIPGYRNVVKYDESIHGMYCHRAANGGDYLLIHSGTNLRRHSMTELAGDSLTKVNPIATLSDSDSTGIQYGKNFYILDGSCITLVGTDGVAHKIDDSDAAPYIPTTYINGVYHEERNLLTRKFNEKYSISAPSLYYNATKGLKYSVTDFLNKKCAVVGIDSSVSGAIYIPSVVEISGVEYKVSEIGTYAFSENKKITEVYISEGITHVRAFAFYQCEQLTTLVLPDSLEIIESSAFSDCVRLVTVYLGEGLKELGISPFSYTVSLNEINYAFGESQFSVIANVESLSSKTKIYNSKYYPIKLSLPIKTEAAEITSVTVDDNNIEYTILTDNEGCPTDVILSFEKESDATGILVTISGKLKELYSDFNGSDKVGKINGYEAIVKCTIAEIFDGRLFLSGNPDLPCTVFYTDRNADAENGSLYVGKFNYFNDGSGGYRVKSLLAVRDMLAVFKDGDDGSGSIFYHKKETSDSGIVSIYPVAYVHSGISATGKSISFLDDPVFLSSEGLSALERENINYQRSIACRSHNVNYGLLKEDLSNADMCVWCGYLVIGVNGKIYLADSRATFMHSTGNMEYEWFFLNNIGAYSGDRAVYRYSDTPYNSYIVHPTKVGQITSQTLTYKSVDDNGVHHYFVLEGGKRYSVVLTDQMKDGNFVPATKFLSHGDLLIFSTDSTDICVFNNDRRGVAPERVRSKDDFDENEYNATMGNRIHPDFYNFAGHAATYVIRTSFDDCGIPHLTKNTVKKSLVIKASAYIGDAIACKVNTDKNGTCDVGSLPDNDVSFSDFFFNYAMWNGGKYTSYTLPEKEKAWIEKQMVLSAKEYSCPIAIYSITYRYTIKGRIKNNS